MGREGWTKVEIEVLVEVEEGVSEEEAGVWATEEGVADDFPRTVPVILFLRGEEEAEVVVLIVGAAMVVEVPFVTMKRRKLHPSMSQPCILRGKLRGSRNCKYPQRLPRAGRRSRLMIDGSPLKFCLADVFLFSACSMSRISCL